MCFSDDVVLRADKLVNAARKTQKAATMQHVGQQLPLAQLQYLGVAGAGGGEIFQGSMVVADKAVGTVIGKKGAGLESLRVYDVIACLCIVCVVGGVVIVCLWHLTHVLGQP